MSSRFTANERLFYYKRAVELLQSTVWL